jgi:4-hydroxybenzoate polyprenyltransferase
MTTVELTRLTMAYGAIADLWLVILLSRASREFPTAHVSTWPVAAVLALGLVVAVGLFAFGASLNDVLDARRDRAFSPERPIPAGRILPQQAAIVTSVCLAAATIAATAFGAGAVVALMVTALGIVFWNGLARHIPAASFITIGLVHAGHMFIPNVAFGFTPPIWLSMSHAMAIAILVRRVEDKRPVAGPQAYALTATGWLFWSALLLGWGFWRSEGRWPLEGAAWPGFAWPAAAVVGFALVAWLKTRGQAPAVVSEKLRRYGAMWQSLYAVSWFAALGLWTQALILGGVAAGGFLVMTGLKELTSAIAAPVAYREA